MFYFCSIDDGNYDFFKFNKISDDRLFPLNCSVDNDFFQKEHLRYIASKSKIRSDGGIPDDLTLCILPARLTGRKRGMDLLKAIKASKNPNLGAIFVGNGPELQNLKDFSRTNGLKNIATTSAHLSSYNNFTFKKMPNSFIKASLIQCSRVVVECRG